MQSINNLERFSTWFFIVASGLILPIFVLIIVSYTGGSVIMEEAAKAIAITLLIVYTILGWREKLLAAFVFGALFGLSETVLYLGNFVQVGDLSDLTGRLIWTVPMHGVSAFLAIVLPVLTRSIFTIVFGFILAVIFHAAFNELFLLYVT